ncbi:MAG: hypothetical protein AMXMBFR13_35240 [Phycisphaerae bacterium]
MDRRTRVDGASGNPFMSIRQDANGITSLRCDASGDGRYGVETVASPGRLAGFTLQALETNRLLLSGISGEFIWDLPFVREGYYDADAHRNYPSPATTQGARPLVLPVRRFLTSAGQYVNIEHFKRLPAGSVQTLNLGESGRLLLVLDDGRNQDLLLTLPGVSTAHCEADEQHLRLKARLTGTASIEVRPRNDQNLPGYEMAFPAVRFEPDFSIRDNSTGKTIGASELMTDLLRMAVYWHPSMTVVGDWGLGAVETHMLDDPRSWYMRQLRAELLRMMGWIGYDRFERFGMMFAWGRFPDYGAGGLLNLPPGNAPYDMRMLHLNGQWIETIARYVLASGDIGLLRSKRVRWVGTDGDEPQPLCGRNPALGDYVLAAGDVRLDGRKPAVVHTLSQTFTAGRPFSQLRVLLGTESRSERARGWVSLLDEDDRRILDQVAFELDAPSVARPTIIPLPEKAPAGTYRVQIGDTDSGNRYFGPGIFWMTDPDSNESVPPGGSGPLGGTLYDRLVLLLDYLLQHTGAGTDGLFRYINDPEYNIANHKSGRPKVCTENSYWEAAGGGYDAFEGLWYNAACRAMVELATRLGNEADARRYRELAVKADRAYNAKYWHTAIDNGRAFQRYHACEDWDGNTWDYGYSYYNLEAICRGIASPEQALAILWWLDRGQWSPDEGKTWKDDIYSIWGLAPPFNTIANHTWLNVTGTLPYREVLANGGTRTNIAARDLLARARHLGADNMHERNVRILARFARPDRLTGGRTFDDPGGRGRWHFGEPHVDRADIEGFREIFPQSGDLATHQVMAYLGMEHTATGLRLRPRVPSSLDAFEFKGIGYQEGVFDFRVKAVREEVAVETLTWVGPDVAEFTIPQQFNGAGILIDHSAPAESPTRLALALEAVTGPDADEVGRTWYSHLEEGQWAWLTSEQWHPPGTYRLRILELATADETHVRPAGGTRPAVQIRCRREQTRLKISVRHSPAAVVYELFRTGEPEAVGLDAFLEPGGAAFLVRRPARR